MADYSWDPSMETGDPLVDQQHRDIHQLVADLACAEDRPDVLMQMLDRLMEHVECHILAEEDLMRRFGYAGPAADIHVADHHRLTETARAAVLAFRTGELTSIRPTAEFLSEWLTTHVHAHDRELIEYVRAHRARPCASKKAQPRGGALRD